MTATQPSVAAAGKPWVPFDAVVWLLTGRWGCVDGWSVTSTPQRWAGTMLLNGKRWRVTVEPESPTSGPSDGVA